MRRGMTLIEAVAAAALLTLIVLACVPLLAGARRDLAAAGDRPDAAALDELSRAVDELLRQRPVLVTELVGHAGAMPIRWTFSDEEFAGEARLERLVRAEDDERRSSHAWMVVRCGGLEAPRWVRAPGAAFEGDDP